MQQPSHLSPNLTQQIEQLEGWSLTDDETTLEKEFGFDNFKHALDFVNKVGALAEEQNHHPDILLFDYKNVRLILTTHSANGLSEKDILLAQSIDQL